MFISKPKTSAALVLSSCALVLVTTIHLVAADARRPQSDQARGTLVIGLDERIGGATVDDSSRQKALALAQAVRDILNKNPAIASPVGFSVRIHRAFGRKTDWAGFDSGLPFFAGAFGTLFGPDAKPSGTASSAPDFGIYVNTVLQCPVSTFSLLAAHGTTALVDGLPVIEGGRRTGEFRGHAIYDTDCIILTRGNVPPFIPVTRERYMRLETDGLHRQLDDVRKQRTAQASIPALQAALQDAETQLTKLIAEREQAIASASPADRSRPAFVRLGYMEQDLVNPNDEGAVPLSTPNPAVFDRSLPPTAVQVVSVYLPFAQPGPRASGLPPGLGDTWRPIEERIRDQFDWTAIEALLKR